MFEVSASKASSKSEQYRELAAAVDGLLQGERDLIANAANFTALVYASLEQVNWAGFYLLKGGELVVGPFQGLPACVRIPLGKGVCGTAARECKTQVVADVNAFPGHIACDARSRSEIVVPLIIQGELIGVFDVDSPVPGRFDAVDQAGMERLVERFVHALGG